MTILSRSLFCLMLVWTAACGQEDASTTAQIPSGEESSPAPVVTVEPVELSPEDQKKAQLAPEGMVFIKGGCYMMGEDFAQVDEQPAHEVCVDDFFMDAHEVTQARWVEAMGGNPSKFAGDDLPVEQVNYYDVQAYIRETGGKCRLPTEAEWEYAARGGTTTRYFWGNMMNDEYAWYQDNSGNKTHPVGEKKPNQYGLHDILGNVWEWTDDWYTPAYELTEKDNPQGAPSGKFKVIRGGAFDSSAGALRVTNRTWLHPKNRVFPKVTTYGQVMNQVFNYVGFRCVRSFEAVKNEAETEPAGAKT